MAQKQSQSSESSESESEKEASDLDLCNDKTTEGPAWSGTTYHFDLKRRPAVQLQRGPGLHCLNVVCHGMSQLLTAVYSSPQLEPACFRQPGRGLTKLAPALVHCPSGLQSRTVPHVKFR